MAGPKVVSRKAKRKQEREDKKRQKNKRQRKEQETSAPEKGGKAKARAALGKRPAKPQRGGPSGGITNKFHEFLAEAASAQNGELYPGLIWGYMVTVVLIDWGYAGEPQSVSAEDKEIKALEAKLGLGSSSSNKAESALKKLKKEYSKDGLGEDFADFLSELDHISEVVKGRPKAAKAVKHSASAGHDGDVESDEDDESEVDENEGSEAGSDFGDDMEMDEETRREMELLQAEDAEFLKGMDELPTDESESESEDLAQFYSDEEDEEEEDDDEARANTLRNQELAAGADADEASDDSEDDGEQEANENNSDDGNDKLEVEEESDEEVADDSDKNDDDDDNEEEQEKEESVVVEEDIYGRPVIRTSDGAKKPSAYLPPHLRRKLQAEAEAAAAAAATDKVKPSQMDEQAMRELTRRINGQLNRISESNMESIALEMEKIYRENGRSLVNEILLEKLLQTTCHPRQVMAPLIKVGGALVAALYHSVGSEVGGFFVEKLVRKLMDSVEKEKKQLSENAGAQHGEDEDGDGRTSKEPVNLMLFVMMLYNFGVVHCTLVYDLFRAFVDSFSSTDIELIHQLLKIGGAQLRADDADALRQMVAAVQQKVGEAQQANDGNQPEERVRFILDLIYDLKKSSKHGKGGKGGAGGGALDVSSLKKWIGRVKTRCGNSNNPLRVSLHELLNADEDGRWWVVGGTWVGYQQQKSTDDGADDTNEAVRENDRLLKLAEKQHMNTDVRKKIFVALMGATDCFDAYERLLQLHLKEKQEREIVRVLLHCCGQENKFNKYYLVLAEKLCEMDQRYKFTFQLAFWDIFKQMESLKPRRLYNQAQMLAGLVLSSSLSLSCLKVLDFTQLEEKSILFLRVLMEEILKFEGELEMAQVFQRLLQTKKAQLTIDGLAVFFHQHLTSFRGEPDLKTRTLLKKRVKSVKSLLDQLAKSAASAEKQASFV
ncbi:hypothetical protein PHYSODRAFT_322555 [Phytophthora sojae]|uniref:MI domain-containing protein n=1 Tax=Phytophthora sojae (strain P6497) TaxID=1094619 RepID=G4YPV8_PHYSP|nr:hypothetical protein PHYSODRAFT_322555 [Phytophthora sojae]EGZ28953.1 hypothetical protein PHYSODRAFT_322555 [Phytophthora sojae]|eukprot:XP_009516228.1 hypothetical protein PHYSODRAFT_322555 [Phytophthora sojae]